MRSYYVKENHNDSAVCEILRYRQTNIMLLYYKDILSYKKVDGKIDRYLEGKKSNQIFLFLDI